ncbi:MAG: sigma D regulator [Pseudomonadaceae bacterium]|nr:sigma D regulator [Pseudomonadaceae bacterium]
MTSTATVSTAETEHSIAQQLGRSRSALLSYLLKLNKCIDATHDDLVQALAQRFNELLVDYVSYGHFRFLDVCTPEAHHLAAIDKSTQLALRFSDKYTTSEQISLAKIKTDLEALAFALEVRFEIEDEVVASIAA